MNSLLKKFSHQITKFILKLVEAFTKQLKRPEEVYCPKLASVATLIWLTRMRGVVIIFLKLMEMICEYATHISYTLRNLPLFLCQ